MTIETKFNIGDKVWFMDKNKASEGEIRCISVTYGLNHRGLLLTRIKYDMYGNEGYQDESELFPSKEELLKSL